VQVSFAIDFDEQKIWFSLNGQKLEGQPAFTLENGGADVWKGRSGAWLKRSLGRTRSIQSA
jgi:hypothetical protein